MIDKESARMWELDQEAAGESLRLIPDRYGPIFRAVATLCVTVVRLLSAVPLVQTLAGWL